MKNRLESYTYNDFIETKKFHNQEAFEKYTYDEFSTSIDCSEGIQDRLNQIVYFGSFITRMRKELHNWNGEILVRFFDGNDFLDCEFLKLEDDLSIRTLLDFMNGKEIEVVNTDKTDEEDLSLKLEKNVNAIIELGELYKKTNIDWKQKSLVEFAIKNHKLFMEWWKTNDLYRYEHNNSDRAVELWWEEIGRELN